MTIGSERRGATAVMARTAAAAADGCVSWGARGLAALAGLALVAMALATGYDVAARYFFNSPTVWATEISTYLLIAVAFLGASATHLAGGHVRITGLSNSLPERVRPALDHGFAWLGFAFVTITAWQAVLMVLSDHEHGARLFSLLLTPAWMPKLPIAVGLAWLVPAITAGIARMVPAASPARALAPFAILVALVPLLALYGEVPAPVLGLRLDAGTLLVVAAALLGALATGGVGAAAVLALVLAAAGVGFVEGSALGRGAMSLILCAAIAVALASGMPIAFALGTVGLLSIYLLTPVPFPVTAAERAWTSVNSFSLTAVPLFVLMGSLLVRSALSAQLFRVMARALARLPGGLAHAGIAGCTVFSAVSGSSVATAAAMGTVACPEMLRRGYDPRLTFGTLAAGGTLGILIPPSVPLIIYGTTVGVPVTVLFLAGILPGLLMVLAFALLVIGWSLARPGAAPTRGEASVEGVTAGAMVDTGLILGLVLLIFFALYGGVATPSEIGAVGALATYAIALWRKGIGVGVLVAAVRETVAITSFIFLIIVAASILTFGFDYLKISEALIEGVAAAGADRWLVLAAVLALYLVLGMFLDSISMLVLTLPIVFPLMTALGFDPVWFGIVLVIIAEIGLITPPVGMNLFVLQGVAPGVTLRTIALGVAPFIATMLVVVVVLCLVPEVVLFLPESAR